MTRHAPDPELLKRAFLEAIELPADQRAALVTDLAHDPVLQAALDALLRAHDEAGLFLSAPTHTPRPPAPAEPEEQPGERVGPFVLESRLGEGGFAVVWRATQEEPVRREVALKILKPGMDSRQVLARFDAERQTLAVLNHPSIARVLDAGVTPRARPYFVMELVDGRPITDFCDAAMLTIPERLRLFIAVCRAVQHAHQKGIIHRDLKPSNILVGMVDGRPRPVIIDFGIAKAVEARGGEASALTEARQLVGTPQYMAPEQAGLESAAIDTRTDVYSLGILLHELLTGVSPYDVEKLRNAGYAEVARIVRESRPGKPSTRFLSLKEGRTAIALNRKADEHGLVRQLRGDLDWIVLRATEKDPESRYPTANALARDVELHLADEPVTAGPPSQAYRLSKFVRRHRVAAASAAVASLAILTGLVLAIAGLRQANDMRALAEDALETANGRLWDSYLAQARASRNSARPGRRDLTIDAVRSAAALRPSLELRNEAIAALALDDAEFRPGAYAEGAASAWGLRGSRRLVRADPSGRVRVVDPADETEILQFAAPGLEPAYAAFSADGSLVAVTLRGADSARLEVWSTAARERIAAFAGPRTFGTDVRLGTPDHLAPWVAVSPEGEGVTVHALPGGETILSLRRGERIARIDATPDGRLLAAIDTDSSVVELWSIDPPQRLSVTPTPAPPISIALHADASIIAAGLEDRSIVLIEPATQSIVRTLRGHQGLPVRLSAAHGGRVLASYAWDNTIRFWDVESGSPILGPVEGWEPAGLGDEFFAVSGERAGFWRFAASRVYERLPLAAPFGVNSECAILPDGRFCLTAGDNGVLLWDARSDRPALILTAEEANGIAALPGNMLAGALETGIVVWGLSLEPGAPAVTSTRWLLRQDPPGDTWVSALPEGRVAAVTSAGIHIISLESGAIEQVFPHYTGLAERPAGSPDGRWLFTGNWRGPAAYVWDLSSGDQVRTIKTSHAVARFSPSGDALLVGTPDRFVCYEVPSWRERWSVDREWTDRLAGVLGYAPDGSFAALGVTRNKLRLVDPATGAEIATLEGPDTHELNDAVVSPDGLTLICTTVDRVAQRWRLDLLGEQLRAIDPGLDPFAALR